MSSVSDSDRDGETRLYDLKHLSSQSLSSTQARMSVSLRHVISDASLVVNPFPSKSLTANDIQTLDLKNDCE